MSQHAVSAEHMRICGMKMCRDDHENDAPQTSNQQE